MRYNWRTFSFTSLFSPRNVQADSLTLSEAAVLKIRLTTFSSFLSYLFDGSWRFFSVNIKVAGKVSLDTDNCLMFQKYCMSSFSLQANQFHSLLFLHQCVVSDCFLDPRTIKLVRPFIHRKHHALY